MWTATKLLKLYLGQILGLSLIKMLIAICSPTLRAKEVALPKALASRNSCFYTMRVHSEGL